ncbi:MAG: ion channel [Saprospiraceae bacterium]|nr:ion channel [Saprospiraceae bacterium]
MIALFNKLYARKYEAYLFSLFVLLFGQMFLPVGYEAIWQHLLVLQNVLVGLLLFKESNKWLFGLIVLLSIIVVSECVVMIFHDGISVRFTLGAVFSIYFLLASAKLYQDVIMTKEVGNEMISAVFAGFIMLGFMGTFLFTLIELTTPDSFSNLGSGETKFQNLSYFSFVSLLTIGYGDIVPLTQIAKKTAMLLGLVGNFYLTFVTAIIIGKYINKKSN